MEPDHWFDSLHRILTREASRRGGLGAAVALLASHILNGGSVVEAARKKRRKNKKRKKKRQRKQQRQRPACAGEPCLLLGVEPGCCEPGLTCCGGLCVNTTEDDDHCGGCNQPCSPGKVCFGRKCECLEGLTLCGEICRDTMRDPNNCGQCGKRCPAGWECEASDCVCRQNCATCPPDRAPCHGQCCPANQWCHKDRECCPEGSLPPERVIPAPCLASLPDQCRPDSSFVCCEGFGCFVGTTDPTDWVCCGSSEVPLSQRTCVRSDQSCLPGRNRYPPIATHTYGQ